MWNDADLNTVNVVNAPAGIFGVPLHESIIYANVAISLMNEAKESFIYGYVPIVVAKCGVFLKEKGRDPPRQLFLRSALMVCLLRSY